MSVLRHSVRLLSFRRYGRKLGTSAHLLQEGCNYGLHGEHHQLSTLMSSPSIIDHFVGAWKVCISSVLAPDQSSYVVPMSKSMCSIARFSRPSFQPCTYIVLA